MSRGLNHRFCRMLLAAGTLLAAGCEYLAPPHQSWTKAAVDGRVVDAASGRPISGASVSRVEGPEYGRMYEPDKGARTMQGRPEVAVSDAEGRFELAPDKTAYLFLESFPDYAVILRVQCSGYETLQQTFTNVVRGTNPQPPRIHTGDLKLKQKPKP